MKTSFLSTCGLVAVAALFVSVAPAQTPAAPRISTPAPSPNSTLKQTVGFTEIEIAYARPSARGRKIFGGLLPYGARAPTARPGSRSAPP
jgi:hypothetical protein